MADQALFCIHCGALQLNADSKFCHQCGQPIVPAKPSRGKAAPWLAPVLVSAAIIVVAAVVLASVLSRGPTASEPTAETPTTAVQVQTALATPTTVAAAQEITTPLLPTPTGTPQPTPALANITPEPVKLTQLAWSPDGKLLAVGSATGVYLYDTTTWQEARFIPLLGNALSVAFGFDGKLLGTESASQTPGTGRPLDVWRATDGTLAYTLSDYGTLLTASPTEGLWAGFAGPGILTGGVKLWRASDGNLVREMKIGADDHAYSLVFSPNGQMIVAGMATTGIEVGETATGRRINRLNWEQADTFSWMDLAFRPDTSTVVAIGWLIPAAVLLNWDADSGSVVHELIGLNASKDLLVNGVSFAQTGDLFATSHRGTSDRQNGSVQLWQADGTRGLSWALSEQPSDIAFSPDNRLLAVLSGQSVYLYDPADGSMARQVEPVWHQGILPTPTPTPLSLPVDWPELYVTSYPVKVRYPPTWSIGAGGYDFDIYDNPYGVFDSTAIRLRVHVGYCYGKPTPGDPSIVEELKSSAAWTIGERGRLVASGKWPILVPATYVELEGTFQGRRVLSVSLESAPHGDLCFWVTLIDEPEDVTDQVRLDVSRVLASIEFPDPQHPFPTATPTFTPTPNPAPPPALPLQISFNAKTSRSASGGGNAEIIIEIRDAHGTPVNGTEVALALQGWRIKLGLGNKGRYETSFGGDTLYNNATVEVYWNQELIAKQDFVISWQ